MTKPGLQQMFNCMIQKSRKMCLCGLLLLSACVTMLAASGYNVYLAKYSLSDVTLSIALPNASLLDVRNTSLPMQATSTSTMLPNLSSLHMEAAVMPAEVTSTTLPTVSSSMPSVGSSPLSIIPKCGYPGIRCSSQSRYHIYVSVKDYIYQHMATTVAEGLRSRSGLCGYEVFEASIVDVPTLLDKLEKGDVWIHVGRADEHTFFRRCKQSFVSRKVYCILYNSEPRHLEAPPGVCEIWDYTHSNQPSAPVVRYLPPGFVPFFHKRQKNDHAFQTSTAACVESKLELFFLGNVSKSLRPHCWKHLTELPELQRFNFKSTDRGIRDAENLEKLAKRPNKIYLNMHPRCNQSDGRRSYEQERLQTVRFAVLLSFGALVISEPANPVDMTLYQDIVIFEKNLFRAFSTWSPDLQELLGNCTKIREFRLQAYESFKQRFHPGLLLANAGILDITSKNHPDLEDSPILDNTTL